MSYRRLVTRGAVALALVSAACAHDDLLAPAARPGMAGAPPALVTSDQSTAVFHANGRALGHPAMAQLVEQDGSYRVTSQSDYDHFFSAIAPVVTSSAADSRLNVNPNYVAAMMAKESGYDTLAVSWMPANGLSQLTYIADLDLQQMVTDASFLWMQTEALGWPRSSIVHSSSATRDATLSALSLGQVTSANEYFFNGPKIARGHIFWLRLLENKWTTDTWPGGYGTFARQKLNGGGALTESQLVDLITVSYNQGYDWVYNLVNAYGPNWVAQLPYQGSAGTEAADYLNRVRYFTAVFQDAATTVTTTTDTTTSTTSGSTGGTTSGGTSGTTTIPAAPAVTKVWRVNKSTIGVSWTDQSTNESGFHVYRSVNGGAFALVGTAATNATSYNDATITRGNTYQYAVASFNSAGESARSTSAKLYAK